MPALPSVPSVLQVALGGNFSGTAQWITRFFIQYTGSAPAASDLTTFNGAVATQWGSHINAVAHNSTNLRTQTTTDLSSSTGAEAVSSNTQTGTLSGGVLPAQVAFVSSYEIARRYRGGHPRGYWPLGDDTKLSSETSWSSAFVTSVQTAIDAFFTGVLASGWSGAGTLTHVNVSYYHGFTVVTNPITGRARNVNTLRVTPVVDNVIKTIARSGIGTQRRREQIGLP